MSDKIGYLERTIRLIRERGYTDPELYDPLIRRFMELPVREVYAPFRKTLRAIELADRPVLDMTIPQLAQHILDVYRDGTKSLLAETEEDLPVDAGMFITDNNATEACWNCYPYGDPLWTVLMELACIPVESVASYLRARRNPLNRRKIEFSQYAVEIERQFGYTDYVLEAYGDRQYIQAVNSGTEDEPLTAQALDEGYGDGPALLPATEHHCLADIRNSMVNADFILEVFQLSLADLFRELSNLYPDSRLKAYYNKRHPITELSKGASADVISDHICHCECDYLLKFCIPPLKWIGDGLSGQPVPDLSGREKPGRGCPGADAHRITD